MARLALLLINIFLLNACEQNFTPEILNRADVQVRTANGISYVNTKPFSGTLIETSPIGDTLSIEPFIDGKEHGRWTKFYARGRARELRYFDRGRKEGAYKAWWENGNPKLHYHFKEDEYDGILKEWDVNGQLVKESSYRAGYEEGTQKAWYSNGKVRSNYVVFNGRRYGLLGTKNCINVADSIFAER